MSKLIRTAKRKILDIDLLKIKQQFVNKPKTSEVKDREQKVHDRSTRRYYTTTTTTEVPVIPNAPVPPPVATPIPNAIGEAPVELLGGSLGGSLIDRAKKAVEGESNQKDNPTIKTRTPRRPKKTQKEIT